ncbi:MAG: sialidase family protein [Prevotella sp.]
MRHIFLLFILPLFASNVNAQVKVADTQGSQYYRIPVILKDNDGNLIALYDDRHSSNADLGNHEIDILAKTSTNNGESFGNAVVAVNGDGSSSFGYGHGDAAAVCDRETGDILVLSASGQYGLGSSNASAEKSGSSYTLTLNQIIRIGKSVYSKSTNSWGTCEDISSQIYNLYASDIYRSSGNTSGIQGMYVSTGRLCQSSKIKVGSHYRIYAVLNTWNNYNSTNPGPRVICSDDFGSTWKALGGVTSTPCSGGDETQIEELPDGNLLLSSRVRKGTGRIFNVFTYQDTKGSANYIADDAISYEEGTWGTAVTSGASNTSGQTYAASCNASLMIVKALRKSDNSVVNIVLQSACMSSSRMNMGIYWKELPAMHPYKYADFQTGWNSFTINSEYACYSSMVLTKDGKVGIFYESQADNTSNSGCYDLMFNKYSLETITSDKYSAMTFDDGMEPRVMLLKSVMSGKKNESRYIYNDGMTMKTVLSTTAEKALSPDYRVVL